MTLNVPIVSISITVLKALNDILLAGHRKLPAAPDWKGRKEKRNIIILNSAKEEEEQKGENVSLSDVSYP